MGRIWINESKYFNNVPVTAWEFYIGGYQPAQKWLKDRKERELKFEDILHYQKIIVALFPFCLLAIFVQVDNLQYKTPKQLVERCQNICFRLSKFYLVAFLGQ